VGGEVDMATGGMLEAATRSCLSESDLTGLIVDLAQVTFLDSEGIRVMVVAHHAATNQGVTFRVANPHDNVRRVLDLTGVLGLLTKP
jgi:anti-anti-sigma factor